MNTTTSNTTTTYTIVPAMFARTKFEVLVREVRNSVVVRESYMKRVKDGEIRLFSSRNGARKAIVRALRDAAGVPGALHR